MKRFLKHMLQSEDGCTLVACLGLAPFEHSRVGSSLGAVQAALEVRAELTALGVDSRGAIVCGKTWIGSAGSETRREFMMVGEPLQLASQLL